MIGLLAKLRNRWDLDPNLRGTMPFEREIAIVNLRRMELACLLSLMTDAMAIALGFGVPGIIVRMAAAALVLAAVPRLLRSANLRLQQAAAIGMLVAALGNAQWVVATLGASGRLSFGYTTNLLCTTLLLLIPPRTLAIVIAGMFVSFWLKIGSLPLNDAERRALIVSTAIVSAIAQLAGWLIYGARQTDHDQKILIRTQNAQLGRQNQELDEIMAITAHDLRGPLHGVRNMLDLAARRDPGGQETALFRAVRESMFSLDAMLGLVTRLLDAHAVEHRPLTAPAEEDLRTHLLAAARRIGPQTAAAAIDLDVRLPEQPIFAVLEGGALGQILDNLLGNAVRHSPPGAPLSLSCVRTDDRVLVAVEDRGPGIDPLHRDALFTKFGRMGPRGPHSGAGMGLFIAHTLAGRIGATLSFRPAAPNGAIFELALPNRGLISLSRTEPVVDKIML